AEIAGIHCVSGRKKRIGQRAQRHAVIEESEAAANNSISRGKRRPREARARRDVVCIRCNGLQELQIIPETKIQRHVRIWFPLVLNIETNVGIRLRDYKLIEGLRKARVVVCSAEEARERGKRVAAANRSWESDGVVVVKEIGSRTNCVRSHLIRQVIGDLVKLIQSRRWRARERAERGDSRNANG